MKDYPIYKNKKLFELQLFIFIVVRAVFRDNRAKTKSKDMFYMNINKKKIFRYAWI